MRGGNDVVDDYDDLLTKFVSAMLPDDVALSNEEGKSEEIASRFIAKNLPTKDLRSSFYQCAIRKLSQTQRLQDLNKIMEVIIQNKLI